MADPITLAFSGLKTAIDAVKFLRETQVALGQAELKSKLAEVYSALADTNMQLADVKGELPNRDKEIERLNEALSFKGKLRYEQPCYYLNEDGKEDGPFCQRCWDVDRRLIRSWRDAWGTYHCDQCTILEKGGHPE